MALPAVLGKLLPPSLVDGSRNMIRDAWNLLSAVPGGKVLFSRLVGRAAPYTGSIGASVVALRPGFAQVELADKKSKAPVPHRAFYVYERSEDAEGGWLLVAAHEAVVGL